MPLTSTEHRFAQDSVASMKRQRAAITKAYYAAKQDVCDTPISCTCSDHDYPHVHPSQLEDYVPFKIRLDARILAAANIEEQTLPGNMPGLQTELQPVHRSRTKRRAPLQPSLLDKS